LFTWLSFGSALPSKVAQFSVGANNNLIADLSADGFADMYAQTITYGLFAARASRGSGGLVADDAALMAPSTNPFLRDLLQDFLQAGGRARRQDKRVDFDELGINEVVATLREVPMDDVLRSFNASKPGDDPVIHFYEDFLKAYDKKMRAKRGVFYTPRPVVQFIVRSVDEILKTEFGIEDGLASTITWGEMRQCHPELDLPEHCTDATPFVQILDPATGTATFIVEVIEHVHAHMLGKWKVEGFLTKAQWLPRWNEYVRLHLLPRLFAFELMMAPYAVAHMKIGIKLSETGYNFPEGGPRVNVFLTNALEPAHEIQPQLESMAPMLAHEAQAANSVKETLAPIAIIGNPPYSVSSQNKSAWIVDLCEIFKRGVENEKNIQPLSDDYIKFMRLSANFIERSQIGAIGLITNREYLRGVLHKGIRQTLSERFNSIQCTDLHGQRGELILNSSKADENVFEIEKGVAIIHLARGAACSKLEYREIIGSASHKLHQLGAQTLSTLPPKQVEAKEPDYSFLPEGKNDAGIDFSLLMPITSLFSVPPVTGFATHRDSFAIDFVKSSLQSRLQDFLSTSVSSESLRKTYNLSDTRDWKLEIARSSARKPHSKHPIRPCLYRPFDLREIIYSEDILEYSRRSTMDEIARNNLALIVSRIVKDEVYAHAFVSSHPVEKIFLSPKSSNNAHVFIENRITPPSLPFYDKNEPEGASIWFSYVYSILHSPTYRTIFADKLSSSFPRIPIPASRSVFDALATLGDQLISWHLLEHPTAAAITLTSATGPTWFGNHRDLTKVAEKGKALAEEANGTGKVFVNATSGFAGVKANVWLRTIGGYQVLHKWLDDRRKAERSLSDEDITHWLRVYAALEATQGLMQQIDAAIEAHGGWPGAFSLDHPPPDAATLAVEHQAQKERLKAQKKAAKTGGNKAMHASPTGATSLFDDLEDMAAAAGDPSRPKAKATPAVKAAGGKVARQAPATAQARRKIEDVSEAELMCTIRTALAREVFTVHEFRLQIAKTLGFARSSVDTQVVLSQAIRRAVRRGIAQNTQGQLSLVVRNIEGYDREFLKQQLLTAITGPWLDKAEVPTRFARHMGFARVGTKIEESVWSLMRSLVRGGLVEAEGRGAATRYRKSKGKK